MSVRTRTAALGAALSTALLVAMAGTALAGDARDCEPEPHRLDGTPAGGDACEPPPRREWVVTTTPATPVTTPATATPATARAAVDRGCTDLPTQAEAQAALAARAGDAQRLDADGDGIACEEHFGTEGRQVAVYPLGGLAARGRPPR